MSYFVIEHKRGVFVNTTPTPHFTWKHAATRGKRFKTAAEAKRVIATFYDDMKHCKIVEKP